MTVPTQPEPVAELVARDHIEYLRSWTADIRRHSGQSVDADRLDGIADALASMQSQIDAAEANAAHAFLAAEDTNQSVKEFEEWWHAAERRAETATAAIVARLREIASGNMAGSHTEYTLNTAADLIAEEFK